MGDFRTDEIEGNAKWKNSHISEKSEVSRCIENHINLPVIKSFRFRIDEILLLLSLVAKITTH